MEEFINEKEKSGYAYPDYCTCRCDFAGIYRTADCSEHAISLRQPKINTVSSIWDDTVFACRIKLNRQILKKLNNVFHNIQGIICSRLTITVYICVDSSLIGERTATKEILV